MNIELDDHIMSKLGISALETKELLITVLYKHMGAHASLMGKLLGTSEIGFRELLVKYNHCVNYDVDDLIVDIETLSER